MSVVCIERFAQRESRRSHVIPDIIAQCTVDMADKEETEKTIAEDLVVTKYKMAGEIVNRKETVARVRAGGPRGRERARSLAVAAIWNAARQCRGGPSTMCRTQRSRRRPLATALSSPVSRSLCARISPSSLPPGGTTLG